MARIVWPCAHPCLPFWASSPPRRCRPKARSPRPGSPTILNDPTLVILHNGPADVYAKGHIPGARWVDLGRISANTNMPDGAMSDSSPLMLEMLPPNVLRERLEGLGISDGSRIVVYAAGENISATTRVIFTLRVAGLGARALLLDGGLAAWQGERRPVTAVVPTVARGTITATPVPALVVDHTWVRAHLNQPGVVIVDARDRSFYDGVEQGESRYGHIPTARNIPFSSIFDAHTKVKSPAELRALFAAAGAQPGDTIVGYCHIGMQATAMLFAANLVGYPVRLYDGSFEDWSRRRDLPVDNPAGR